nr:MAG TPA: hypothetical protein [Caudoviricetes sp.]
MLPAPERQGSPKRYLSLAGILYHLRSSHASGTFVRAGCYFCTYFSRHLRRRNKKETISVILPEWSV